MQQKTTLMPYLLIGISFLLAIIVNGCKERVDYEVKARWIYINETDYFVSYSKDSLTYAAFNVKPHSTTVYEQRGDGDKNTNADSYVAPLQPYIIYYGNFLCDTLSSGPGPREGEGPIGMSNYTNKKLDERYYEFTYRFTDKDLAKADTCK